jgi:hypothetical protein
MGTTTLLAGHFHGAMNMTSYEPGLDVALGLHYERETESEEGEDSMIL